MKTSGCILFAESKNMQPFVYKQVNSYRKFAENKIKPYICNHACKINT
ncbi:hypothetical protein HMPREF9135_2005 [Segatella baroniae F0067]|uniref:Uncharacterized protein n=1 Tax=Segatella baroniae F0067 TaxID=1115809 RepID=U2P5Y0_9BACT|nr:hypothetical protein HMPREF9135_2005 [Segatella baroniae F0067]